MHLAPGAGKHLHGQEETEIERVHQFGGIHHHHEAVRAAGHQLFLDVAGAAALDQLEGGIHFIGAINGEIDPINGIEAL